MSRRKRKPIEDSEAEELREAYAALHPDEDGPRLDADGRVAGQKTGAEYIYTSQTRWRTNARGTQ